MKRLRATLFITDETVRHGLCLLRGKDQYRDNIPQLLTSACAQGLVVMRGSLSGTPMSVPVTLVDPADVPEKLRTALRYVAQPAEPLWARWPAHWQARTAADYLTPVPVELHVEYL